MSAPIERAIASITEDRRAGYLFNTKAASDAVGCVPNKFGDWWRRTRQKLVDLSVSQPAETGAELCAVMAEAAEERGRRGKS